MALGLSLAACGGNSDPGRSSSPPTPSTVRVTTSPATTPGHSIFKDVHLLNCAANKHGWSAGGTVQDSLSHAATYVITVFFTSSVAENLDYGSTSVRLKAGQITLWSVSAVFAAPTTVRCVLTTVTTG